MVTVPLSHLAACAASTPRPRHPLPPWTAAVPGARPAAALGARVVPRPLPVRPGPAQRAHASRSSPACLGSWWTVPRDLTAGRSPQAAHPVMAKQTGTLVRLWWHVGILALVTFIITYMQLYS